MARIRTIKPDFFRHEALYEAEHATKLPLRVAFAGLWTVADREGRIRWQPRVLKLDVMPFDEVDFVKVLNALVSYGFLVKYEVDGLQYAHIPSWHKHQQINSRETASVIPAPDKASASTCTHPPEQAQGDGEGKGREGKVRVVRTHEPTPQTDSHGTRIEVVELPPEWAEFCREKRPDIDPDRTFALFVDYWKAQPGSKGRKADWPATWRNWVRNQHAPPRIVPVKPAEPDWMKHAI